MPEYEVTVRYRLEWTAILTVKARNESGAEAKIEKALSKIHSYKDFEALALQYDVQVEVDEEEAEIDEVIEA
mgnify:FL=1